MSFEISGKDRRFVQSKDIPEEFRGYWTGQNTYDGDVEIPEKEKKDDHYLYVFGIDKTPYVKIGISGDVLQRRYSLVQPVWVNIRFCGLFSKRVYAAQAEAIAHMLLRGARFHGEWFLCKEATAIAAVNMAIGIAGVDNWSNK
jgi:hypothetical protein